MLSKQSGCVPSWLGPKQQGLNENSDCVALPRLGASLERAGLHMAPAAGGQGWWGAQILVLGPQQVLSAHAALDGFCIGHWISPSSPHYALSSHSRVSRMNCSLLLCCVSQGSQTERGCWLASPLFGMTPCHPECLSDCHGAGTNLLTVKSCIGGPPLSPTSIHPLSPFYPP